MNNKKFLIAVLSLILLFAISCNEDKTGSGGETIYNVVNTIWIDNKGKDRIKIGEGNQVYFSNAAEDGWQPPIPATKNGNTITIIDNTNPESVTTMTITFTSDTTGRMSFSGSGADGMPDVDITKKM